MIFCECSDFIIVQFNNAHNLNALSQNFINILYEQLIIFEKRNKIIIFTGVDKAFSVGLDIKKLSNIDSQTAYKIDLLNKTWDVILNLKVPTIAVVNGYALGGGFELALMCDFIFADSKSKFGLPEVNLGLIPGLGGVNFLNRVIGQYKTNHIIMSGDFITAQAAFDLNLITDIIYNENVNNDSEHINTSYENVKHSDNCVLDCDIFSHLKQDIENFVIIDNIEMFEDMTTLRSCKDNVSDRNFCECNIINYNSQVSQKHKDTTELVKMNNAINNFKCLCVNNHVLKFSMHYAKKLSEKSIDSLISIKKSIKQSNNLSLSQSRELDKMLFYNMFSNEKTLELIDKFINKVKS